MNTADEIGDRVLNMTRPDRVKEIQKLITKIDIAELALMECCRMNKDTSDLQAIIRITALSGDTLRKIRSEK